MYQARIKIIPKKSNGSKIFLLKYEHDINIQKIHKKTYFIIVLGDDCVTIVVLPTLISSLVEFH